MIIQMGQGSSVYARERSCNKCLNCRFKGHIDIYFISEQYFINGQDEKKEWLFSLTNTKTDHNFFVYNYNGTEKTIQYEFWKTNTARKEYIDYVTKFINDEVKIQKNKFLEKERNEPVTHIEIHSPLVFGTEATTRIDINDTDMVMKTIEKYIDYMIDLGKFCEYNSR